jgi:hypothetical protein
MMNTNLQLYTPPKSSSWTLVSDWLDGASPCVPSRSFEWLWCEMRERRRKPSLARYLREARRADYVVVGATIEDNKITLTFANADGSQTSVSNPWDEAIAKLDKKVTK